MSLLTSLAFRKAAPPSICLPMQQSSGHLPAGRWLHCQGASALCYLCETNAVYLLPLSCRAAPAIQQQLLCLESALLLLLIFQSAWGCHSVCMISRQSCSLQPALTRSLAAGRCWSWSCANTSGTFLSLLRVPTTSYSRTSSLWPIPLWILMSSRSVYAASCACSSSQTHLLPISPLSRPASHACAANQDCCPM